MTTVYIGAAALLGAITAALLGYTESQEPFNMKKFASSIIRAIIGGIGIAVAFNYSGTITPISYMLAFLSGAGVDAGGKRIAGAISARLRGG